MNRMNDLGRKARRVRSPRYHQLALAQHVVKRKVLRRPRDVFAAVVGHDKAQVAKPTHERLYARLALPDGERGDTGFGIGHKGTGSTVPHA
jgi:hypothetical protein